LNPCWYRDREIFVVCTHLSGLNPRPYIFYHIVSCPVTIRSIHSFCLITFFRRGSSGLNNPIKLQELIVRLNTIFHPNHYLVAQVNNYLRSKYEIYCFTFRNSDEVCPALCSSTFSRFWQHWDRQPKHCQYLPWSLNHHECPWPWGVKKSWKNIERLGKTIFLKETWGSLPYNDHLKYALNDHKLQWHTVKIEKNTTAIQYYFFVKDSIAHEACQVETYPRNDWRRWVHRYEGRLFQLCQRSGSMFQTWVCIVENKELSLLFKGSWNCHYYFNNWSLIWNQTIKYIWLILKITDRLITVTDFITTSFTSIHQVKKLLFIIMIVISKFVIFQKFIEYVLE